jgi:CheY-like chemotaxis protein
MAAATPNLPAYWKATVLIVDDTAAFSNMIALTVAELGRPTFEARSATEALSLIEAEPPALVLSDFEMPGGSGLMLLEATRARWPQLPFVLWSAASFPTSVADRARQLDARVSEKLFGSNLDELLRSVLVPA